uniref:Immunoglobulin V-set domain-containing protein n=1 Tax=Seriola lalandi dorsalis TaxID=1841481 RepID=A0A3B4XBI4_SERLL
STFWSYICLHVLTSTVEHTGPTGGNDVNQTPILWKNQGESAKMHCNYTKGAAYYQMYWYRQLPGKNMKPILFIPNEKAQNEPDFGEDKFPATKPDAQSGTLTVKNLDFFIFLLWIKGKLTFYFRDGSRGLKSGLL